MEIFNLFHGELDEEALRRRAAGLRAGTRRTRRKKDRRVPDGADHLRAAERSGGLPVPLRMAHLDYRDGEP